MSVYLEGRSVKVEPAQLLGKGGEADVYDLGDGRALKLFKPPDHPDHQGLPAQQQAARMRLDEHQTKLRAFPAGLPPGVVTPLALATDKKGKTVLGYAMSLVSGAEPLLRYGEASFRRAGVRSAQVVELFRGLYWTIKAVHAAGVVVGDFNDLNVLVRGTQALLIDADSFQYGAWVCRVFTERFVDPRLCHPSGSVPALEKPLSVDSDWYAFNALLFQSLLCVGPFGGIHRPPDAAKRVGPGRRSLERLTVLHPEVQYPKPALPPSTLPDEVLHHFEAVFAKDARGVFPVELLDRLTFRRCAQCGLDHARAACPACHPQAAVQPAQRVSVRGKVKAARLFETRGTVLHVCVEEGELRWLVHEGDRFVREDGTVAWEGPLEPFVQVGLRGKDTCLARGGELVRLSPGRGVERLSVDARGTRAAFACNAAHLYWAQGGQLFRDGPWGPETVGQVLAGHTLLWMGATFGVGLYQVGGVSVGFTFDAEKRGVRDTLALRVSRGHLLGAECVFTAERAWLFLATQVDGRKTHHAFVLSRQGEVLASAEVSPGEGGWLDTLTGKCAVGALLLAATDEGLVRVEIQGSALVQTRVFPDTEPFVDSGCTLLSSRQGLCVVGPQGITALTLG